MHKKQSCGISMGLGFRPWNFKGVSHNFSWDSPTFSILFEILTIDDMQDNASDMLSFLLKY